MTPSIVLMDVKALIISELYRGDDFVSRKVVAKGHDGSTFELRLMAEYPHDTLHVLFEENANVPRIAG